MTRRLQGDRGSVMPMTAVLVVFLLVGVWALVSASQQWAARRDAQGVAAAAARAQTIIGSAGYTGTVTVDGQTVVVTVNAGIDYAFPSPGFPSGVSATASAVAVGGVTGADG